MGAKNFTNVNNEEIWSQYEAIKYQELELTGKNQKQINSNLAQYRSAVYKLESANNNESFSTLTVERLQQAKDEMPTKKNHMNGFIVDCVTNGIVNVDIKTVIACLDTRAQKVFKMCL